MDMERCKFKKLNEGEFKELYQVIIRNNLQLWKTYRVMGASIGHGTLLERTAKFQLKAVLIVVN
jgi:hypothetical protein